MFTRLKNSNFVRNYRRMWPHVKPYRWRALAALLVTIPVGMMDAVIAWSLKPYMDGVISDKPAEYVLFLPFLLVVFGLFQGLMNYASTYLNKWTGQKIANDMKLHLFGKLMTNDSAFFDKETSGQVLFRFNNDVDMACAGLLGNLKIFVTRIVSSISLIAVLFWNSWILAILAVVVLAGALYPLSTIRRKIEGLMSKAVMSGAVINTHYNETFSGNRVITAYNLADYQKTRFEETLKFVFKIGMKMTQRTGLITPMMHFIVSLGIAGVLWAGSYLIIHGDITPGNFISFLTALIMLYTPIKGMGNTFSAVQMSFLAMERVWTLFDAVPNIRNKPDAIPMTGIKTDITYNNVWFEYTQDKPVLKGINLRVRKGQTVAFVGNSGGGKSTISSLLPRFYEVTSGSIAIDGVDVRDYELTSLRDNIAVVFQDNFLFTGTIRSNILLGQKDVSDEALNQAVADACLSDFIATLADGLDTEIGERGVLLSGGQRQRVAIARAFLKNAPIVVLDEATSALDNKSEAVVQQAINNLMKDRTVFVIAHRLSTIKNADKIVVISDGNIVEEGTHDDLIQNSGTYAALYNM